MKKYKLSIVVCVADDVRIKDFLDSVNQNCEVVVVLNGATKEVEKIVNKYKNNKIFNLKIVKLKERNLSKSRNEGILKAQFDKVLYYDSDCVMTENAIELFDKKLNDYLLVDGKVLFRNDTFQSRIVSIQRSMGLPGCALCPAIGIHKKIIKKIKYYFDEDIKWIEDSELNIRAKKENIEVGIIDELTCIHDNLTFKVDLRSAFRYGTGVKIAAKKGLHKNRPTANWNLIIPCFKEKFLAGIYCVIWNIVYCVGYYVTRYK